MSTPIKTKREKLHARDAQGRPATIQKISVHRRIETLDGESWVEETAAYRLEGDGPMRDLGDGEFEVTETSAKYWLA